MNIHLGNRLGLWLAALVVGVSLSGFTTAQTPASPRAKAKEGRATARGGRGDGTVRSSDPAPTFENVAYGPNASNRIDFWKASSSEPVPIVVFIHGGGFRAGDKADYDRPLLAACLASGISYASINYRLSNVAPYPAQMQDSARAIQFIRSQAVEWNIDPINAGMIHHRRDPGPQYEAHIAGHWQMIFASRGKNA